MDAEEKARIEAEMAEKLEALAIMENEKREKDEELERIRLQVDSFFKQFLCCFANKCQVPKNRLINVIFCAAKIMPNTNRP